MLRGAVGPCCRERCCGGRRAAAAAAAAAAAQLLHPGELFGRSVSPPAAAAPPQWARAPEDGRQVDLLPATDPRCIPLSPGIKAASPWH
eukprot:gene31888-34866_t